ncbi:MAG TPA: glutaredoxin domain-containing protein [Actinomycetota bacterium]|jgi:mycoredoxin|nr:glutaredoxin domain-containing protein [Actinomycetota bacterium]
MGNPGRRAIVYDGEEVDGVMNESVPVTMYTTVWCGYCRRLKRQLEDEGIPYREIDVDEHEEFGERIVAKTGGFRTVPTVQVGDELLVNPSIAEIRRAVETTPLSGGE